MAVPRIIHVVWVGDESKRPDNCIATWRQMNQDWTVRVWGNADLAGGGWKNRRHLDAMAKVEWNGVADLMRWEILLRHGGFAIDADSVAIAPLETYLFEGANIFAPWENERAAPNLLAAGYVASAPGEAFFRDLVDGLHRMPTVTHARAWKTVGPTALTRAYEARKPGVSFRVWPSHYFLPEHHSGAKYAGGGAIYARQLWAATHRLYDRLHARSAAELASSTRR